MPSTSLIAVRLIFHSTPEAHFHKPEAWPVDLGEFKSYQGHCGVFQKVHTDLSIHSIEVGLIIANFIVN